MKIDLSKLIKIKENTFFIEQAIYKKKSNSLKLFINGDNKLKEEDIRNLEEYFSYTNLSIKFIKNDKDEEDILPAYMSYDYPQNQSADDLYDMQYGRVNEDLKENDFVKTEKEDQSLEKKEDKLEKDSHVSEIYDKKKVELENMMDALKNSKKKETKSKETVEEGLNYGRKIKADLVDIASLYDKKGMTLSLIGRVYGLDIFETKSGFFIYTFDLEDKTDAVSCKMFINPKNKQKVSGLKNKMGVQVEGVLNYDNYAHEDVFTVNSIREAKLSKRLDTYPEKRIELEVHTKMTNLDGFVDPKELLNTLKEWGHDTVGITDTATLQALPDLYNDLTANDIKMLLGAELLLVDRDLRILTNYTDKEIDPNIKTLEDKDYIVFDLETTGLSAYDDKITEIGAVRVSKGQIVEVFNELLNPEKFIPEKVQEITGITNEMVAGKPTIDEVLPRFLDFSKDAFFVGQNADFDIGFVRENCLRLGIEFEPIYLDTLPMARAVFPDMGRFSLDKLARKLNVELINHHRASDDATATAKVFIKLYEMIYDDQKLALKDINKLKTAWPIGRHEEFSSLIFAKNKTGLQNLYRIISETRMKYFYMEAKTPFDLIEKYRDGIILGSGGHDGLLFKAIKNNMKEAYIEKIASFFDFYQVEPLSIFVDEINQGNFRNYDQVKEINKKIVELGKKHGKLVCATGGVRYLNPGDYELRNILHKGQFFKYHEYNPLYYLRTTNEMLEDFSYFDDQTKYDLVINNPKKLAETIENIRPIPNKTFPPKIDGSDKMLTDACYTKAKSIYGDPLPEIVEKRLKRELDSIIGNGYAVLYIIAKELVRKSNEDGYLVGSRGSVGSSFAATMADITEVNPLVAHYVCPECKYSEFITDGSVSAGIDLPDKKCPKCGHQLNKDGHTIPFEVFLGFEGDKEPDIDLNFAGEYQPTIHKYTEEFFGKGKVFRAGTIGTIKDNTAFGYIKKYAEDQNLTLTNAQIRKYQRGLLDVKRTTGQHPGGLMVVPRDNDITEFSPVQYPADDPRGDIKTTHFTYNMMHGVILKLDLLGHDVPTIIRALQDLTGTDPLKIKMDDQKVMSIFSSTQALNIKHDFSNNEIGTLGIPEFGTSFVRSMLKDTYPKKFSEMTRISGLSHGTDVWLNNAQDLVTSKTADFDQIISTRDDIMNYLINMGLDKKKSFQIMEKVRKGKSLDQETIAYMRENNVPEWYIESCLKIKYLFPKAHAVAYCLMSYRIAYYKVYYPQAFYATYYTTKLNDFQYSTIINGLKAIQYSLEELNSQANLSQRDKNIRSLLEVAEEMEARDIHLEKADLYASHPTKFLVKDKNVLPPLAAVDDVSEAMAIDIGKEREKGEFISLEDLKARTCLNKNALASLKRLGIVDGIQEENQMSLFDL
ncbi:MAG: PolC-type DNA polymerase III [Peptoniphilaceae bacterium]|nr:PolC-type DNA polymerase III [Peptoniphilaceae bacterium]MDY6019070.1 PolC-type DNA polymerase III [Anaerococcus sp.]